MIKHISKRGPRIKSETNIRYNTTDSDASCLCPNMLFPVLLNLTKFQPVTLFGVVKITADIMGHITRIAVISYECRHREKQCHYRPHLTTCALRCLLLLAINVECGIFVIYRYMIKIIDFSLLYFVECRALICRNMSSLYWYEVSIKHIVDFSIGCWPGLKTRRIQSTNWPDEIPCQWTHAHVYLLRRTQNDDHQKRILLCVLQIQY